MTALVDASIRLRLAGDMLMEAYAAARKNDAVAQRIMLIVADVAELVWTIGKEGNDE